MDIRPSAAVRAALASIERSEEGRSMRTRLQSRAMEKSVVDGAEAARMSAARVADNRAHAAMLANDIAAERRKDSAPRLDMATQNGSRSTQQQAPRPGSVVDVTA